VQLTDIFRDITISEEAAKELERELSVWFDQESNSDAELKQAESRLVKLRKVENTRHRLKSVPSKFHW
jgi:hypothetical protein